MEQEIKRITKRLIPGVTLHPRDGYYQIRQIGLTAQRVKNDPAFNKTRQQAKEFAGALKAAKLICDALLPGTGIKNMRPRLISLLLKALKADTTGIIGHRNLLNADWSLLKAFECNREMPFHTAIGLSPDIQFLPDKQQLIVSIPPFIPANAIHPPEGITHYRIFSILASLDVGTQTATTQKCRSGLIPHKQITMQPKPLITNLLGATGCVHILATGVEWYTRHNVNNTIVRSNHPATMIIGAVCVT